MSTAPRTLLTSPWLVPTMDFSERFIAGPATTAATWPAANRALYQPFSLPSTQRIATVTIYCGTASGTYDIGFYDETGLNRIASLGSTTLNGTAKNVWTPAVPILIEAGRRYYLGMSVSNTTATILRHSFNLQSMQSAGYAQQATAHPLPNPAVPAQVAATYIPAVSFTFVQ